ncbi:hypothetical protein Xekk_00357 [Xenorhabdus sp. KK7.4]|nr:hypothetical protein Xekk_00357 [Xenorhabdus sp. KK7.4]
MGYQNQGDFEELILLKNEAKKQQTSASARLMLLFSPIRTITVGSRVTLDLLTSIYIPIGCIFNNNEITTNRALAGFMKSPEDNFILPPVGTFTLP